MAKRGGLAATRAKQKAAKIQGQDKLRNVTLLNAFTDRESKQEDIRNRRQLQAKNAMDLHFLTKLRGSIYNCIGQLADCQPFLFISQKKQAV